MDLYTNDGHDGHSNEQVLTNTSGKKTKNVLEKGVRKTVPGKLRLVPGNQPPPRPSPKFASWETALRVHCPKRKLHPENLCPIYEILCYALRHTYFKVSSSPSSFYYYHYYYLLLLSFLCALYSKS